MADKAPWQVETIAVHTLWAGRPRCNFVDGPPMTWPLGHKWASRESGLTTCELCLANKEPYR
jgi:hypothetical protein